MPGLATLAASAVSIGSSLAGGSSAKSNDLTGYNYLANNNTINQAQGSGQASSRAQQNTQNTEAELLGVGGGTGGTPGTAGTPGTPGTPAGGLMYPGQNGNNGIADALGGVALGGLFKSGRGNTPLQDIRQAQANGTAITPAQWAQAGYNPDGTPMQGTPGTPGTAGTPGTGGGGSGFNNYLNSTGYKFQLQQGGQAVTGNNAARGNLNSGATGKALTTFGQNIGSGYFQNYLTDLGNLNNQQGATAGQGIGAAQSVGQAGTTGGGNAGEAQQSAISTAGGTAAGALSKIDFKNFLGS